MAFDLGAYDGFAQLILGDSLHTEKLSAKPLVNTSPEAKVSCNASCDPTMRGASLYSLTLNAPYIESTFISFSTLLRTSGPRLFDSFNSIAVYCANNST